MKTAMALLIIIATSAFLPARAGVDGLTSDHTIAYGTQKRVNVIMRIFYTLTPTTQLNEVGIGEINYRYVDVIGKGISQIEGPYEITSHTNLGSCDRVGRGPISTSCFNNRTGNAIACRVLVAGTDWEKLGSGHAISSGDHDWVRNAIRDDIREGRALRSVVDSTPAEGWAKPKTYSHALNVLQPGGTSTLYNVSGDRDKTAEYCIYSVYEKK
ncbi:hypothetical protein ILX21_004621 [Salmonella enterica]|uniref:Uncharacterized protein n=1 Tax=Salmonella enterica TaxID=28901 RepID=A0A639YS53_SALER|nr:hypothetical protein [Salmonella enterica]EDR4319416.1 hypothetical protein [Salmonella enterica subsp. enterica serovar Berta]EDU2030356.1 hypothetical protein [Salmonella enterica subsp. enterica serovar Pensacola]ECK3232802.1 hypothetical protein [Salmonella enterica]ECO9406792.1 hypothetical protein [Salmonella enterica]